MQITFDQIRHNDEVTIFVQNGFGRHGQEWKQKTGQALMQGPDGWILYTGDAHEVATEHNFIKAVR